MIRRRGGKLPRFGNSSKRRNEPLSVFEDMFITRSSTLEGAFISTHMADFHVSGIPETWNGLLEYAMPGMKNNSDRVCSHDSERRFTRRIKA